LAGAENTPYRIWLEDWQVEQIAEDHFVLEAANGEVEMRLELQDVKGPILHGDQGFSQKGSDTGNASYYYSQTRLKTSGEIRIKNMSYSVSGLSWKDHEFSTSALSEGQVGWDWFSVQLNDKSEVMLFQLRNADGSVDHFSGGTYILEDGSTQILTVEDFSIETSGKWRSPHSDAQYPMNWVIRIPEAGIELNLIPYIEDQELNHSFTYWEGAVFVSGRIGEKEIDGDGYVEMTGYAESMEGQF
jgi:predicted secreted hydrolase